MAKPTKISEAEFSTKVLEAQGPVLVDFYADWCGPCKMIAPMLEELAGEYDDRLSIVKIDVDQAQQLASSYGIMSIPTLMIFKDGKPAHKMVGALPKPQLRAQVEKIIGAATPAPTV